MRITEVQEDMGLSLETSQQFVFIGEFEMHYLYGIDMVVFLVARNIDGGKIASSSFINEFITTFDDTSNHVTVHDRSFLDAHTFEVWEERKLPAGGNPFAGESEKCGLRLKCSQTR